jgi:hypothetical protein
MPKRHTSKKGGFSLEETWGSIKQGTTNALNETSQAVSGAYNKTKEVASNAYNDTKNAVTSSTSAVTNSVGGRRRRTRRMRGGSYTANTPLTGLASNSVTVSNVKTAQPNNIVGGKSRTRRRHKHSKSCKSCKRNKR